MVRSKLSDVVIPNVTIHDLVWKNIQPHAHKIALVDAVTKHSYTYAQLKELIKRVASGLVKLGVSKGDVVAIVSPNSPEFVMMFFAILQIGGIVTTMNPEYTTYEMEWQMKDCRPSFVFTVNSAAERLVDVARTIGTVKAIISLEGKAGCVPFARLMEDDGGHVRPHVTEDVRRDTALILYSSGTTGRPKGILLTNTNMVTNMMQQAHPGWLPTEGSSGQMVMLGVLPFFHAYAIIMCLCSALNLGYQLVTLPKFRPESFLQAIQEYKVSTIPVVPPIVLFMLKSALVSEYNLESVRYLKSSAAPVSPTTQALFKQRYPHIKLLNCFGATEGLLLMDQPPQLAGDGSAGQVLPNSEIQIRDVSTGQELGAGELGQLCARSTSVMKGYLNNPDATREAIDSQGWLHTGDLAYYDEDERVFMVDRIKELIKVKGFQVAPAELEALLLTHPDVRDVGVIGVRHEQSGEVPRAFIVRREGSTVTEAELQGFVREKLIKYKWLAGGIEFVDAIPKSPSGKILRRILRQREQAVKSKL